MSARNKYMREYNERRKRKGLCIRCGKPLVDLNYTMHEECRYYKNNKRNGYRHNRMDADKCAECDNPLSAESTWYCDEHLNRRRQYEKQRAEMLKQQGICVKCRTEKACQGVTQCGTCFVKWVATKLWGSRKNWRELIELFEKQNRTCPYSNRKLTMGVDASIDHKIPASKGGSDDIGNLHWVHYNVNMMKWDMPENEFLELVREIANTRLGKQSVGT